MLKQTLIYTANNLQRKFRFSQQPTVLAVKQTHLGTYTNTIWCQIFVHRRELYISQNVTSKDKKETLLYGTTILYQAMKVFAACSNTLCNCNWGNTNPFWNRTL
jgi:hypothetical protein